MTTPRYFTDCHGLSLDECEAKVRDMIENYQADALYHADCDG
jgi:hypothetical protein